MEGNKISVIMGIYNCAETLPEAIESIINQTYQNWELILCDDCSTDNSYEVARKYQVEYPDKIFLLKNEVHSYLAFTLNHCLEYATGKYIARMDGDDISHPERFEKQVAFLSLHEGMDLVGTAMQRFNEDGDGAIDRKPEFPDKMTPYKTNPFNHATILAYKYVFDKLNGYVVSKRTRRGQDMDLWYRFFYEGFHGANMQDPYYKVREDMNAIRRRTFLDRWYSFERDIIGYRLLRYPFYCYLKSFLMIWKWLVPAKAVLLYRKYQAFQQKKFR